MKCLVRTRRVEQKTVVLGFYFILGLIMEFPILALRLWLKGTLEMDIAAIGVLLTTVSTPWTLKPLYGFVSDQVPLCGRRRQPYIILCNVLAGGIWFILATVEQTPTSVLLLCFVVQIVTCFGDVLYDASMVELSKHEGSDEAGSFQSWCWAVRAAGAVTAAGLGGVASANLTMPTVFKIQALLPLLLAALATFCFDEPVNANKSSINAGCSSLRRVQVALCDKRLWKPALFVCVFAATPSSGTAWFYYLVNVLHFTPNVMGALSCLRHAAMLGGALAYRRWFRACSFRPFFSTIVVLSALLSLTPLILVEGINASWGIPDVFFVGGDDVFLATVGQIAMMPCLVMAAKLCPSGIEASLYATCIAFINVASILSEFLGACLTAHLGVTHDNFEALPNLILICSASSLVPLLFVWLLPDGHVGNVTAVELHPIDSEVELADIMATISGHATYNRDDERRPCLPVLV